jgi:hypothetical protein
MRYTPVLLLLILLLGPVVANGQQKIKGYVTDKDSTPLPFATVKLGNTWQGFITDLDGRFEITTPKGVDHIEVFYLGYESKRVQLDGSTELRIVLSEKDNALGEVVIKSPYEKINRILNNAIANRDKNNPEKYDWYRCKVYYKMIADVNYDIPDSLVQKDTSGEKKELKTFLEEQHLLMSETYSRRTWKRPQKLQEEVIGTRLSGFKKPLFTGMVTDVLPFHAYNDYIALNGKDYHNPVSRGFYQHFKFDIEDEVLQGTDTIWILSFKPQSGYTELTGRVYIHSDNYAIAYLVANAEDKALNREIRLEQQYKRVSGKWFPEQLNYILKYHIADEKTTKYDILMRGNSKIDSVSFEEEKGFKFDKAHSVQLLGDADVLTDSAWNRLRPEVLQGKELKTYQVMDSLMEEAGIDKIMPYLEKLPEGKVPISVVDMDLSRLYSVNKYEGSRLGLGLQTNEKIAKWLSVGGWFGYGFRDKEWKYGGFAEIYADKRKEFVFRFAYDNDLKDPGRVSLNKELDKNYLRRYLMNRVDQVEAYSASVKKRLGYWTVEIGGRKEYIMPRYNYNFRYAGNNHSDFEATEILVNWRYAFAERRAPFFGKYYSTGTKYPVWYGKVVAGTLESGSFNTDYIQAITAVQWQKHINRIGNERILLIAGKTWSNTPLPLSKSFAGNGLRFDQSISLYSFGGLLTMYPYEYYSDEFVSLIFKHDFDWRLYSLSKPGSSFSSSPYISLGHNILYGRMKDRTVHDYVAFSIPDIGYHESGLMLNSLLRMNYLNVYHITFNAGYFYHWTPVFDMNRNGRYVVGVGVDL